MGIAGLIAAAKVFGAGAVSWVIANSYWLIPMGTAAIDLIYQKFGN